MIYFKVPDFAKGSELYFFMTNNEVVNLLPYDGIAFYFGKVLSAEEHCHYFIGLSKTIEWKNDEAIIYGKRIITKRMAAWYGNEPYRYTYSGITKQALPWTKELYELKQIAEVKTGETFNACLLNLYHNGEEGMGWHSDNEATLQQGAAIASFSLGAERKFMFRHKKTKELISVLLESGSLLIMKATIQANWHHSLPKTTRVKEARINLTFRSMKEFLK